MDHRPHTARDRVRLWSTDCRDRAAIRESRSIKTAVTEVQFGFRLMNNFTGTALTVGASQGLGLGLVRKRPPGVPKRPPIPFTLSRSRPPNRRDGAIGGDEEV